MASLEILRADMTDTAKYFVVVETKQGIVSSSADVNVFPTKTIPHDSIEIIIEMPSQLDIFQYENLRLIYKVDYDLQTSVNWSKDGFDIHMIDNKYFLVMEDYGCGYIGLTGINATTTHSGEYTLTLKDKLTNSEISSVCDVYVGPMRRKQSVTVTVNRPLQSAVANIGSEVIFDCTFALKKSQYYCVVWYVGPYRIERSDSKFGLIWKAGEYILYIKKLEADMAGKVVCELRQCSHEKMHIVGSSAAYLAIVPPKYVEEERINNKYLRRTLDEEKITVCIDLTETQSEGVAESRDFDPIDISYCRLDEESSTFLKGFKGNIDVSTSILCTETNLTSTIQWGKLKFPSLCWFTISIPQSDGSNIEAGECSKPEITIRMPPLGTLLKIRVTCEPKTDMGCESSLTIDPVQFDTPKPPKNDEVRPMEEYKMEYTETRVTLGCGGFGKVVLAQNKDDKKDYAVKLIESKRSTIIDEAKREYDILKKVQHKNIVQLVDAFEGKEMFAIVMEYFWGGDLFERLIREAYITEDDVKNYLKQICEALEYLHGLKIVHLDIKPENVVCQNPNSRQVKIIDFGLAKTLEGGTVQALCGSKHYMAPEIMLYNNITTVTDMWSVGVVAYVLLSGNLPFKTESESDLSTNIITAKYDFSDLAFNDISEDAKGFIDKLLIINPEIRMSAGESLKHPWLRTGARERTATAMKRTKENMQSYLASRAKWRIPLSFKADRS